MTKSHALRSLALGAAAITLLSGAMATDARAFDGDVPEWTAPVGVFVEPEVVFMQFSDSNTDYAAVGTGQSSATRSIDSDYEAGWRFGIGYRWENRWSVGARWTRIEGDEHDTATAKTGEFANNFLTGWDGDAVHGSVDRNLDIGDIEVSRVWGDMDGHNLRLFFGPRYMSYDESLEATTLNDMNEALNWGRRDHDVEAWGVRVGIEGHVALGHETGWSFFGYGAVSALFTNVDARWMADYDLTTSTIDQVQYDDDDGTSTGLEAGLGFEWDHVFASDWTLGIRFGWEVSNYTDFAGGSADSGGAFDLSSSDDLGLNGGFVRFAFTF